MSIKTGISICALSFTCSAASFTPKVTVLAVPGEDTQAWVCTIEGFLPQELSVKWKKNANYITGSSDWAPQKTGKVFSAVSVLKVKNADWDSKAVYACEVTHQQLKYTDIASKGKGLLRHT